MTAPPLLTDDVIAAAMRQAKVMGCPPTGRRCSSVPRTVKAALATLDAAGWCRIGSIQDVRSYGPAWDLLCGVDTGEVRMERLPKRVCAKRVGYAWAWTANPTPAT